MAYCLKLVVLSKKTTLIGLAWSYLNSTAYTYSAASNSLLTASAMSSSMMLSSI